MKNITEQFMEKMQLFFPMTKEMYRKCVEKYGMVIETIVIEDIFMPEIIKLLQLNEYSDLLEKVFIYIEETVNEDNNGHLIDILLVTVFEILGNDRELLKRAKQYMGPKSLMLQIEADKELGRI